MAGMSQASERVRRAGRARTKRVTAQAVADAQHAADLLAWQDERAQRIRAEEQARAARIAAREQTIMDATVEFLLSAQAQKQIMAEALARCARHRATGSAAVAGLREAGLTRSDIARITGLALRDVAVLLEEAGANPATGSGTGAPATVPAAGPTAAADTAARDTTASGAVASGVEPVPAAAGPHGGAPGGQPPVEGTAPDDTGNGLLTGADAGGALPGMTTVQRPDPIAALPEHPG
jgi:hypothetical protein